MLIFNDLQKTLLLSIFGENRTHVKNMADRNKILEKSGISYKSRKLKS